MKYLPLTMLTLGLLASPASAASWLFYCGPVDPKTDAKTCAVFDDNIGVSVVFEKRSASTTAQAICIFEGNFNFGRPGMIRIDDQKAIGKRRERSSQRQVGGMRWLQSGPVID